MKFTRFRKITAGILAAIAATLLFQTSIARAAEHGPLLIHFEKCFVENPDDIRFGGFYRGTVSGDFDLGTVIFTFESLFPGEVIWRFSGLYLITTPRGAILARAAGIDNLRSGSGHDVLNGEVIAGAYQGAQVQVRAHDFNEGACSQGTITITPSE